MRRLALFNRVEITDEGRAALAAMPEDTRPSQGDNHPAALAFHELHQATQLVIGIVNIAGLNETAMVPLADLQRVSARLVQASDYLVSMKELLERQERQIEQLGDERAREREYIRRIEEKNSELVQAIIDLRRELDELEGSRHEAAIAEGA